MHTRPVVMLTSLSYLGLLCAALDASTDSVRIALTALPKSTEWEVSGSGGTATTAGDWDRSGRITISGYWSGPSEISGYLGLGAAYSSYESGATEQSQFGIVLEPGLVGRVSDRAAVELGLMLGIGVARLMETGVYLGTAYEIDAAGAYAELGLVARPIFFFDRALVFVELGALSNAAAYPEVTIDFANGAQSGAFDLTISTRGLMLGLGGGIAF